MTNQVQLQQIATNLAGAGFPVFPMTSKKVPLVPRGYHDATTDADTVDLWFRKPGVARVAMKADGKILCIDLDKAKEPGEVDGEQAFSKWCKRRWKSRPR